MRALDAADTFEQLLIHTGQHYDASLSEDLFHDLSLPKPDVNLRIGSGSHAEQTGRMMMALEPVLARLEPDWVFTVGDANSTLAGGLVAAKLGVSVAHLEAGLRCHDRSMPDEINRIMTDQLSQALFTTEPSANENLKNEGVASQRIYYVGNVLIDCLDRCRPKAVELNVDGAPGLAPGQYVLVTLHHPSNVDSKERLSAILTALGQLAAYYPVVFPLHPRAARNAKQFELESQLAPLGVLRPAPYIEFLALEERAGLVITDSSGVQEETTVLGVPCITLRPNTERAITLSAGTNRLFTGEIDELVEVALETVTSERRPCRPELWDGQAAERIARITVERLTSHTTELAYQHSF